MRCLLVSVSLAACMLCGPAAQAGVLNTEGPTSESPGPFDTVRLTSAVSSVVPAQTYAPGTQNATELTLGPRFAPPQSLQWNFSFLGTDGFGDSITVNASLTTTSTKMNTTNGPAYQITGITGSWTYFISGAGAFSSYIGGLQTVFGINSTPDNLLYTNPQEYLDTAGLGFTVPQQGGDDFNHDVNIYFGGTAGVYCESPSDEPTLCGPVGVTTPEPGSLVLFGSGVVGLLAFAALRNIRKKMGTVTEPFRLW